MTIRQNAFLPTGNALLKGALHCHTTRSDGRGTPEAVIRLHAEHGYDFMALTDHRRFNRVNHAPDVDMLILPGMEMDRDIATDRFHLVHCFHTVCLGGDYAHDATFPGGDVADQDALQPLLDEWHAHGCLTFYCHPEWSGTPAREFERLRGNFAMELWNSGCVLDNDQDCDAAHWDALLAQGQKLYGVAVDDGHGMEQHCLGWVRVNAQRDVASVLAALKDGAFYSSCGPEIYDFCFEDGVARVRCSAAAKIRFHHAYVPTVVRRGVNLTEAEWRLPEGIDYVRAVVGDADGRLAWTNPIFLDGR